MISLKLKIKLIIIYTIIIVPINSIAQVIKMRSAGKYIELTAFNNSEQKELNIVNPGCFMNLVDYNVNRRFIILDSSCFYVRNDTLIISLIGDSCLNSFSDSCVSYLNEGDVYMSNCKVSKYKDGKFIRKRFCKRNIPNKRGVLYKIKNPNRKCNTIKLKLMTQFEGIIKEEIVFWSKCKK